MSGLASSESAAFSDYRAETVSRSELIKAYGKASLGSYREGGAWGKEWATGGDPCDECMANEEQGPIPIDEGFQSGDDAPAAHPRCECALLPVFDAPDEPDSGDEE
jgi:hypothetical protein